MCITFEDYVNSIPDVNRVYYLRGYQLTYADITPFKRKGLFQRRYLVRIPVTHTAYPQYGTRWREFIVKGCERVCVVRSG